MKKNITIVILFITYFSFSQNYVNINGLKIYYETHGHGEPLLILHGGAGSTEDMKNLITYFSSNYFVIAYDRQGHGKTSNGKDDLSFESMTENAVKFLNYMKLDSINVIGFSDGGIIALDLAINHPEKIKKAVFIATNYHHNGIPESEKEWIRTSNLPQQIKKLWLTSPKFSINDLNKIKCPSLILIGDRDGLHLEHTISFYENIENSELSIIPNATHDVIKEKPKLVNTIIHQFLNNHN